MKSQKASELLFEATFPFLTEEKKNTTKWLICEVVFLLFWDHHASRHNFVFSLSLCSLLFRDSHSGNTLNISLLHQLIHA